MAIIAIDFDGTIVTHDYPRIGSPIHLAISTIKDLIINGHKIILWTMRSDQTLDDAVKYLGDNGIILFGINRNPDQNWSTSPKAYAQVYIDDAALGCPLIHSNFDRPQVNWTLVRKHLRSMGLL